MQHFHVLLVYLDGFLFERKCCLVEVCFILFHVRGLQVGRALRLFQRATEIEVGLGHVIGRSGRHVGNFVLHQPIHGIDGSVHALLLLLQAGLKWLSELHGYEIAIELFRENQCRTRRKGPGTTGSIRSRSRINAYDFRELFLIERVVMPCLVYLRDFEASLDRRLDWEWKFVEVAPVHIQRLFACIGLLVEVPSREQRVAA